VARAQSDFAFLEDVAARPVEVEDEAWCTVLAYPIGTITVEVELDWRERCAFVLVCRTVDRRRPPGYYMHDGRRMRVHLAQALDGGDEQDRAAARLLRSATSGSGPEAMATQLHSSSSILRERIGKLENRFEELFPD
jgi:hypothetical protein